MKVFFTSDLHFGHENVIKFDNRPFETVEEMDEELIERWNNKVGKGDIVYVLGDLIWKTMNNDAPALIKRLNGQIILIKGNHDRFLSSASAKKALAGVKDYDDICVELEDGTKRRCILSHYFIPFYIGNRYSAIHLHGHSHNTKEAKDEEWIVSEMNKKGYNLEIFNVGCMHWNYEPVTLDEILKKERYLAFYLDDYYSPSVCSFSKLYFGTLDDLEKINSKNNDRQIGEAIEKVKKGELNIKINVAYSEQPFGEQVKVVEEQLEECPSSTYVFKNVWGVQYLIKNDGFKLHKYLLEYDKKWYIAFRMQLKNPKLLNEERKSDSKLQGQFWGYPNMLNAVGNEQDFYLENSLLMIGAKYDDYEQAKADIVKEQLLDTSKFYEDIFGDG